MGIEQHLVGLLRVGAQHERPAVAQLEVRDLQLHAFAVEDGGIFAPVELEGLSRREDQRDEGAAPGGSGPFLLGAAPGAGKGGHPIVGTGIAELFEVGMHLPQTPSLLAALGRFGRQPTGQGRGQAIQLAGAAALRVARIDHVRGQVLADGVAGDAGAPDDLTNRHAVAHVPASYYTQYRHVDHSLYLLLEP